jgi:hypothetical protein
VLKFHDRVDGLSIWIDELPDSQSCEQASKHLSIVAKDRTSIRAQGHVPESGLESLSVKSERSRLGMVSLGTVWRHQKVGRIVMVFRCLREGSIYNVGASLNGVAQKMG